MSYLFALRGFCRCCWLFPAIRRANGVVGSRRVHSGECFCLFRDDLRSELALGDDETDFEGCTFAAFDGGPEETAEASVIAIGGERRVGGILWVVEECDGVAGAIDGGAFCEPGEVTGLFCVGVLAGENVGGGGGVDAHSWAELKAGVFGIPVELGVASDGSDHGGLVDLDVAIG